MEAFDSLFQEVAKTRIAGPNGHHRMRLTPKVERPWSAECVESGKTKQSRRCPPVQRQHRRRLPNGWNGSAKERGVDGLRDRSSRPLSLPSQTAPATCTVVEALRRQRYTGKQIAVEVGVSPATVSRILQRLGINKLSALEPAEPVRRYEREHPGEIIHIDIKKLGRSSKSATASPAIAKVKATAAGSVRNICIWRSTTTPAWLTRKSCPTKNALLPALSLQRVALLQGPGVKVQRVMTDNGTSFRSRRYAKALRLLKIKHLRTKPYTPKTNGKAERFVQTSLREWAYAQAYLTSDHRAQHLHGWLHRYNWHRPHTSLKSKPPISRLGLTEDNLLRLHS